MEFAYAILFVWPIVIVTFLKLIEMYLRKQRPKETKVKCPLHGTFIKDFELMQGHCIQCPEAKRLICKSAIIKQVTDKEKIK